MGHWYTVEGEPMHSVLTVAGDKFRPTTLRDARKLGLAPSVTTVRSLRAKPELDRWKMQQLLGVARHMPPERYEAEWEYADRVMKEYEDRKPLMTNSQVGTESHAALESLMAGIEPEGILARYSGIAHKLVDLIGSLFPGVDDWVCEHSFADPVHGYGGTIDIHSPSAGHIIDGKSKIRPIDSYKPKDLTRENIIQLAAYGVGAHLPGRCVNIYYHVEDESMRHFEWSDDELADGWDIFKAELDLWKLVKKYRPWGT